MPRTEEQYKEIRELKRQQIMDSALGLFAEKGFDASSINMIANRAGVSKGLMYNYFESKEDLIITIIHNGLDEFLTVFDANKDGVLTEGEFVYFIDKTFEILKENLHFWKLYFMVMAQPEVLKLVEEKIMGMLMPFLTTLAAYYRSKGYENPMAHARFFGAMLDGISLSYLVDPGSFPIDDIKKIIISKFI